MPVFTWEGRTRQGTTKKGVMEAATEAAVMAQLRAQMIVPVITDKRSQGMTRKRIENLRSTKLLIVVEEGSARNAGAE